MSQVVLKQPSVLAGLNDLQYWFLAWQPSCPGVMQLPTPLSPDREVILYTCNLNVMCTDILSKF